MKVRPIEENDCEAFKRLFADYYAELDCEDDPLHLFDEYVLPDLQARLFEVAVAECGNSVCGFAVYQIDDLINDWNFKEGCGDLRELFVSPAVRGRGLGRMLLGFCEQRLTELGATEIYTLPVEESENFFIKCGYSDTGEYCAEADNKVFGKSL
ncbi:MAG: GNAT family N-acetyltransferase [Clostridia bacterium]|nr:GNAT family N-acetyltransferase [Clostridia bacterium]